jgi:hypothetical protein
MAQSRLHEGCIQVFRAFKALFRAFKGSIQALLRLYSGPFKALFRPF